MFDNWKAIDICSYETLNKTAFKDIPKTDANENEKINIYNKLASQQAYLYLINGETYFSFQILDNPDETKTFLLLSISGKRTDKIHEQLKKYCYDNNIKDIVLYTSQDLILRWSKILGYKVTNYELTYTL